MKVAFVTSHPIQYQVPVFRELTKRGNIDLTVLYSLLPGQQQQGDGFGVPFEWDVPLLSGYSYDLLRNVAVEASVVRYGGCDTPGIGDYLRRQYFDAVIVNGWVVKSCVQALHASLRLGLPCLVRGEANHLRARPWWKRLGQRLLVHRYSGFLTIGEANRAFYRSYGVREEEMFNCLYCVDNDLFSAMIGDSIRRRQARERWHLPASEVCFLFSGKFEEKKHPLELLHAFRRAIEQGMRAHLLMVGDGELRAACEQFVKQYCLPVRFAGFVNQRQMPEAYLATDCLVLPSDAGETWGLVVNEAMASGRPALVSNLVGCRADLIEDGVTGASFPFGNWSELSDQLIRLSSQPELLNQMGEHALERIQGYSPLKAAEGMEEAIRTILQRRATKVKETQS